MKRLDFLKRLGIGAAAIVVAPKVLAEMPAKEEAVKETAKEYHLRHCQQAYDKWQREAIRGKTPYPMLPNDCYSPEEIIKIWRQTGKLLYTNG